MKEFSITGFTGHDRLQREPGDAPEVVDKFIFYGPEEMQVHDGYHTMDEVYDHRIANFMALCRMQERFNQLAMAREMTVSNIVWKSKNHHPNDKPMFEGWFVMGIGTLPGHQITYHLPLSLWDACDFAQDFLKAPEFDGHTPQNVIERLKSL